MKSIQLAFLLACAALLAPAAPCGAQDARFLDINDAVPRFQFGWGYFGYYNSAATAPDPTNANRLVIGLDAFRAGPSALSAGVDTISFRIAAPDGYAVKSVAITQTGSTSVSRIGFASATGSCSVGGVAYSLGGRTGTGGFVWNRLVDLTGQGKSRVAVSITSSVSAATHFSLGSSSSTIASASVLVTLEPLTSLAASSRSSAMGAQIPAVRLARREEGHRN